ncbi:AsmA protein [Gemmobacter caeni]|uniref:AsmA protein n=1 Tax=Gemmobacter caeni TaxID=589035 RepID=A0A2T6BBF7_9RHOB|nr:AsmA family protein [Gemmobacter caeni]PTX53420.1 AsmA protein [Gemmobacter caeni]TWJ05531.1 AsmA protein [Gemmobacter caeni]
MRWLMRIVSSLLVLVLLLALMVFLMPKDRIARLAETEFARTTGRVIEIGNQIRPTIWPVLGVTAGPVRIANPDWAAGPDLLHADRIAIGLKLGPLFDGQIRMTEVEIDKPELLLERRKDGRTTWAMGGSGGSGPASGASSGAGMTLGRGTIRDGRLRFIDRQSGTEIEMTDVNIDAAIPEFDGPARIDLRGLVRGQPVTLNASVEALGPLLAGELGAIELQAGAGKAAFGFKGKASLARAEAEGHLTADLGDRPALEAVLGRPLPDLPEGLGARAIGLSADLTRTTKGALHLRKAEIALDDTVIRGEADLLPGADRPRLQGRFTTERLTLPGSTTQGDGKNTGDAGWSTTPIDVSGLSALDAEISLSAGAIAAGPLKLGQTQAGVTLDRARAVVKLTEAAAYGGGITGQFVLNGRQGLSVGGDLSLKELNLQPLLQDLTGTDRLLGRGNVKLSFLGSGASVDAILRSLSGDIAVKMGKGEILGLDIVGMLRTMDPGYVGEGKRTIFDTAGMTAKITNGIAVSDDLNIAANLFTAGGAGQIDLGARSLDYRLLPRLGGDDGVEIPVLIKGPWASPKIRLDLEWLTQKRLDAEKARAEERAKARLEELAKDKLGVTPQEGESLETAAKRRAQEALEAETGRILDKILNGN